MGIREATIMDTGVIHALNTHVLHHEIPLEAAKKQVAYLVSSPFHQLFVYEEDKKVIGYIQLSEYTSTYEKQLINVVGLAVDPIFHGQGIGKKLVQHAEKWASERGITGLRLNSGVERTEAHAFYQHLGFTEIKEQKQFKKDLN